MCALLLFMTVEGLHAFHRRDNLFAVTGRMEIIMNIDNCKAYELIKKEPLADIRSEGYILRHKKTGARVCLISNTDANKVFCIGFRTPAKDSTGVAHIVEHTVLCGSENFPAKDPFVELVKGSLNTFLNAMTYPDKTIYPVASVNDADFQNLMHVYLDAVFYPNIYRREEIFKQEGWHYELESEEAPVMVNGVVYNEMKGAFSSAEEVLERQIMKSLYPDTTYHHDSGGDPEVIPQLSYQEFLNFHSRYYHPSNSYIYLYGNMDMEEKLNWIDETYLGNYEYLAIDSAIRRQQPFTRPVEVKQTYSISSTEPVEDNTYLSCNFSIDTVLDAKLYIAFDILSYVLLGAPGAPVKKALLDAGIGKDVMGSYETDLYQPVFSIVAKNTNPDKKEEFLAVIEKTLKEQTKSGLNKKSLRAALNSTEFKWREADFGPYPKGLMYGLQCLDSWLYDDCAPFNHMGALGVIDWLKEQVETDYFEKLIEKYLIENLHRSMVMILPERGLNAKKEKMLEEKLAAYKKALTPSEIAKLVRDTGELEEYQETPSTQEELLTIPMLTRKDMKREAEPYSIEERSVDDTKLLFHDVETNGIAYLDLLFDTSAVAVCDIPYIGILAAVLGFVDTECYRYGELADEINLHTGGIYSTIGIYGHMKDEEFDTKYEVRAKVLYDKLPKAMELISEILRKTKFSDSRRIYEILAQLKSRLQMSLSAAGHSISAARAVSYFSKTAKYGDMTSGIEFYRTVSRLEENYDKEKDALAAKLEELTKLIFRPENLIVSLGGREEGYEGLVRTLPGLRALLWDTETVRHEDVLTCTVANEGFYDASQVQYVSRAGNFKKAGFAYTGTLRILKVILSYEYLWVNIRMKGGAYGCMSGFNRRGDAYFSSYRDPNLEKTNEIYEGTPEYLRSFDIDERDMTKYIIGTFSEMDTPLTPSIRVQRSLTAYLTGITFADIQKERDEVLNATQEDIRALADLVEAVLAQNALCVIGNEEKLREQAGMFKELKSLY